MHQLAKGQPERPGAVPGLDAARYLFGVHRSTEGKRSFSMDCFLMAFLVLLSVGPATAQFDQLSFEHFSPADGLFGQYNDFVYQDSLGYVWISSLEGVFRSDGVSMKQYIPNQMIQSNFYEDGDHNLWFSSYEAMYRYVRAQDTLQRFQLTDRGGAIEEGYHVFYLERNTHLWLHARGQIYRAPLTFLEASGTLEAEEWRVVVSAKGRRFAVRTDDQGYVRRIYGCYWLEGSGLEIIDVLPGGRLEAVERFYEAGLNGQDLLVNRAYPLPDGTTWFSSNQGLFSYRADREARFSEVWTAPGGKGIFSQGALLRDRYLLAPEKNRGFWIFDTREERFYNHFLADDCNPESISTNTITGINIDRQDLIWISHFNLAQVDFGWLHRNQFQNPLAGLAGENVTVTSIVEDDLGQVWCATRQHGLKLFDLQGRPRKVVGEQPEPASPLVQVQQLSKDPSGWIWGVGGSSIVRIDPATRRSEVLIAEELMRFFFLIHLSPRIKLISTNNGLYELRWVAGKYEVFPSQGILPGPEFQTYQLIQGTTGVHFVPRNATDLFAIRLEGDSIRVVGRKVFPAEVYDVIPDSEDRYLVATADGIYRLEGTDLDTVIALSEDFALPAIRYSNMEQDRRGRLWLTSNQGLWSYEKESIQTRRFDFKEGFPIQSFSDFASHYASDGRLWLGGNNGLMVFHPDSIRAFPYPSSIRLNTLEINDEPYLDTDTLNEIQSLELEYRQNTLQFDLSAITHYFPSMSTIHFRLRGWEEKWQSIDSGDPIRFSSLTPGTYHLEMYSTNSNGLQSPVKAIEIMIKPPIWQRWWFVLSVVFGIIALSALGVWVYLRRRLRIVRERQQAREAERERIGKELHDDLGAGLTDIRFITEYNLLSGKGKERGREMKKINLRVLELMENMEDIIWALDRDNDTLENLLMKIQEYVYQYLEDKELTYGFSMPEIVNDVKIKGERRRNIYLIVKEVLHNAVRHAACTKIEIEITTAEKQLTLLIADDGKGFHYDQKQGKGKGLSNIGDRTQQTGGSMKLDARPGQGVQYQFTFPLGK